jgi:hypothetical protein
MRHPKHSTKPKADLPPPTTPAQDRDAFGRAIEWVRQHGNAAQIEDKLRCEGFEAAGEFAAYSAQCDTLRLRPWQAPPCHVRGTVPSDVYGCRPGEIALRDRLLAAGLSLFEPDPLSALAASERK